MDGEPSGSFSTFTDAMSNADDDFDARERNNEQEFSRPKRPRHSGSSSEVTKYIEWEY